jgi:predicted glutamine amidotransferase
MCGIAGILRVGKEPIAAEQLKSLLLGIQHRGTDATGIAIQNGKDVHVYKTDEIAWKFIEAKQTAAFLEEHLLPETDVVLLHTRAATQGDPAEFKNNHPMWAGKSAVIHNGMIQNDDELFKEMGGRKAETDSDVIRAIVDKYGMTKKGIKQLQRLRGSCAAAIVSTEFPGKLMLLRAGSPLVLGKTDEQLIWCSIKEPIHRAARIWRKQWGIWFQANRPILEWNPMVHSSAYIIDYEKLRKDPNTEPWHDEFDVCNYYNRPTYGGYETYASKRESRGFRGQPSKPQGQFNPNTGHTLSCTCRQCKPEIKEGAKSDLVIAPEIHGGHQRHCHIHNKWYKVAEGCLDCQAQDKVVARGSAADASDPTLKPLSIGQLVACPKCHREYTVGDKMAGRFLWDFRCATSRCGQLLADVPAHLVN